MLLPCSKQGDSKANIEGKFSTFYPVKFREGMGEMSQWHFRAGPTQQLIDSMLLTGRGGPLRWDS